MSTFIESLEQMTARDSKVRAVLKRSLAFDPGTHPPAFPFVEYRVQDEEGNWNRQMYYLVAGLWAMHWREGQGAPMTLAQAAAIIDRKQRKNASPADKGKNTAIERRFIALLDADETQLPHRLRQMISLLKDHAIEFDDLLKDLRSWNHPARFVQIKWAKQFYHTNDNDKNDTETIISGKEETV